MSPPDVDDQATADAIAGVARDRIRELLARYGIDDPDQAHRLVRERFSTDDLVSYQKALAVLDGLGALDR